MIELFGNFYPWSREALQLATNRILSGDELTICRKEKTAWINKYHSKPQEINLFIADVFIHFGLVGIDSGNFETGEEHYNYSMR